MAVNFNAPGGDIGASPAGQNWFQKNPVATAGLLGAGVSAAGAIVGGILAVQAGKKARKEQAIANMLMRQTGLSATSKYKGLSLFNSIYHLFDRRPSSLRSSRSK